MSNEWSHLTSKFTAFVFSLQLRICEHRRFSHRISLVNFICEFNRKSIKRFFFFCLIKRKFLISILFSFGFVAPVIRRFRRTIMIITLRFLCCNSLLRRIFFFYFNRFSHLLHSCYCAQHSAVLARGKSIST